MTLEQYAPGQITGLDLFPGIINILNQNAQRLNLSDRVKGDILWLYILYRKENLIYLQPV